MAIAKHYLTSSSTFFVGWAWVVFLRDAAALVGQESLKLAVTHQVVSPTGGSGAGTATQGLARMVGLVSLDKALSEFGDFAFTGALASVIAFGPMLSFCVIAAKSRLVRTFEKLSVKQTPQEIMRLQRAAARARLARLGVMSDWASQPSNLVGERSRHHRHTIHGDPAVFRPLRERAGTTGHVFTSSASSHVHELNA